MRGGLNESGVNEDGVNAIFHGLCDCEQAEQRVVFFSGVPDHR